MTLYSRWRARAWAAMAAALFLASTAGAAPILGTAGMTDGSGNQVSLQFSDRGSPVSIDEFATMPGLSTVLGRVALWANDSGEFSLGARGQKTHAHESRVQFSARVANTAASAVSLSTNFLINAGRLTTRVLEGAPANGEYLEAGYAITMSFAGAVVFESAALLRQVAFTGSNTIASLMTRGTVLDSRSGNPQSDRRNEFYYEWDDYSQQLGLGVLAAGASALFEYDVRTFVRAEFSSCGNGACGKTSSSIGDPFGIASNPGSASSIGGPGSFSFDETPTAGAPRRGSISVPEPGTLGLLLAGLIVAAGSRRRRLA